MRGPTSEAHALIEEWSPDAVAAELRDRPRMLVLFHAEWCDHSQRFMPEFETAEAGANVPFARVDLGETDDPSWDAHGIHAVPTLVYFEHGEPLERTNAVMGAGLLVDDLEEMLDTIDALEPEPILPRHMHGMRVRR